MRANNSGLMKKEGAARLQSWKKDSAQSFEPHKFFAC